MEPDRLVPIVEAARVWLGNVNPRTLYREHERGRLALVKVGRSTFVTESEIRRYRLAQTRSQPPKRAA